MAFVPVVAPVPTFSGLRAVSPLASRSHAPAVSRPATRVRMIATEPAPTTAPAETAAPVLPPRAVELLSYIRAHKSLFRAGLGFNSTTATLFRKNDTGRSFTPDDELDTNAHELPGVSVARYMLAEQDALVAAAVDAVAAAVPAVAVSDELTNIIKFNMFTVLRVVSYGAAAQSDDFVHTNNIGMMSMLHEELGISPAVIGKGLDAAKDMVVGSIDEADLIETTAACFDAVKEHLA